MATQSSLIDNRTIRVFISSTFQDMQDERTELIRRTFPRLREMAAQRDVTLTEVDLRWGITPEESESGKVMEICLREVENSIPFFIGIIGNRYGWVPAKEDISEIVEERFPDVPKYVERHLSATEIEMQFGVLDRKDVDMNAYFFINDRKEPGGEDDQESLAELKKTRLAELKKAVRENKKYPVSSYSTPEDLASQVLAAFTKLLDDLFPVGELSALEKERLGQRAVLNNLSRVYIKNEANYAVIDAWMEDWEKHQLVITGESGLGKSALVANWVKKKLELGDALPYRIIYHFVGYGGSIGSDWHVTKALCDEIRDRYGFEADENEPKTDDKVLDDLFKRVAVEGDKSLLIVLDGINQIIDVNYSKRLNWLPIPPRKVKILFTTLEDDETMLVFKDRQYPIFTLQPLTRDDRIDMVRQYLDQTYRKHLEDTQLERIVDDPQNVNTLVLKTLLDEVANFGVYEKLDEKIEEYLKPDSIGGFYQVVLQNYEADFGEDLVRHFLSLIAVSRNGLSEDELLEITGTKGKPILWSQFFCSFRQHLIVKNGLITFSHNYIREAIEERYIKDQDEWVKTCREEIVAILENQKTPDGKKTARSMDEVPYQLDLLEDLEKLHAYLMDLDVFSYLYKTEETTLGKYWGQLISTGFSFSEYLNLICNITNRLPLVIELRDFNEALLLDDDLFLVLKEQVLQYELSSLLKEYFNRFGKEHPYEATFNSSLTYIPDKGLHNKLGDYAELAFKYAEKSLELRQSLYGEIHPDIARSYDELYWLEKYIGDPIWWEAKVDDSFKNDPLWWKVGGRHPELKGRRGGLNDLDVDHFRRSCEYKRKALEVRKKLYGVKHPVVAKGYLNLTFDELSTIREDVTDVIGFYDELYSVLDVLKSYYGENHPDVAKAYLSIGNVEQYLVGEGFAEVFNVSYVNNGDVIIPEHSLKGLEILRSIYGDNHPAVAKAYNTIGGLSNNLKALEILEVLYGNYNIDEAILCEEIAHCFDEWNDPKAAIEYKLRAFEIRRNLYGEVYPLVGLTSEDFLLLYGEDVVSGFLYSHYYDPIPQKKKVLHIPDGVTGIGDYAFRNCTILEEIHIPKSVTSIKGGAFMGCTGLKKIIVSPDNYMYDSREECNAIIDTNTGILISGCQNTIIPNGVTGIGDYAFCNSTLKDVRIPDNVISIGESAFRECTDLINVHLSNGVTDIKDCAFMGCKNLKEINIPDSVTRIGISAFRDCDHLSKVHIADGVTSIGDFAFADCWGLDLVHIPESVVSIGENAFDKHCSLLIEISIPDIGSSVNVFNAVGDEYEALGKHHRALEYRNKALRAAEEKTDLIQEAYCLNCIGRSYKTLGQIANANDYFRRSAEKWKELGDDKKAEASLSEIIENN